MGRRSNRGGGLGGRSPPSLVQPSDKAGIQIYHVITMATGPPPFQTG